MCPLFCVCVFVSSTLCMCPFYFLYVSVLLSVCVRSALCMCPFSSLYVSVLLFVCVRSTLCMCQFCSLDVSVLISVRVRSALRTCPFCSPYVSVRLSVCFYLSNFSHQRLGGYWPGTDQGRCLPTAADRFPFRRDRFEFFCRSGGDWDLSSGLLRRDLRRWQVLPGDEGL